MKMKAWIPLAAAALCGIAASAAPAEAQWGTHTVVVERPAVRHVVVERPIVRHRVVYKTVVTRRPRVVYRVVHRPVYAHRVAYAWRPWRPHRWHDRPTCRLPERWLCR